MKPAPLLELRDARVVRNGRTILHVDGLELRQGEHVVILGPNGAGKSTLIGLLTRDILPLHAEDPPVRFMGRDRWDLQQARSFLGVVSHDLQETHDRPLRVRDVVASGFFGSVGLWHRATPSVEQTARVSELLALLEVEALADRRMHTLSTGEARRVLITRALVHDPAVLVLDEPCAGLDPHAAYHVREAMTRLAAAGHTLVLVTHHVEDIVPAVRRVIMMRDARIVADGPVAELMTDEALGALFDIPVHVEERGGHYRLW